MNRFEFILFYGKDLGIENDRKIESIDSRLNQFDFGKEEYTPPPPPPPPRYNENTEDRSKTFN